MLPAVFHARSISSSIAVNASKSVIAANLWLASANALKKTSLY
jgi:hypothetical protein